jgi:hypothetical protein
LSKAFEVRGLSSGTVQRLRWQGPIIPAPETRQIGKLKIVGTQIKPIKDKPVCFAHDGFAVAGAANGNKVHVWDAERGDEMLSLDHGGECHEFEGDFTKIYCRRFESTPSRSALYGMW